MTSFRTTSFQNSLRGQEVFFGKGQCATCHLPPYYTDNSMHNLHTELVLETKLTDPEKKDLVAFLLALWRLGAAAGRGDYAATLDGGARTTRVGLTGVHL